MKGIEMSVKQKKVPSIALSPVKSSQIESIGYDLASKTLAVKFNSGGIYHYAGVNAAEFESLQKAKSIGSHFGSKIRNVFKHTKI